MSPKADDMPCYLRENGNEGGKLASRVMAPNGVHNIRLTGNLGTFLISYPYDVLMSSLITNP